MGSEDIVDANLLDTVYSVATSGYHERLRRQTSEKRARGAIDPSLQ